MKTGGHMKKAFVIGTVILLVAFIFLITYSIDYFQNQGLNLLQNQNVFKENEKNPEYHFAVIAQNTADSFWMAVKEGCMAAASEYNVAVEFNAPRFTNLDEQMKYLNIAIASHVDGIVTHVLDEEKFTPLIDKAVDGGIPVITIEAEATNSKRNAYIGTSTYNLGNESGKLVLKSQGNNANVVIIQNNYAEGTEKVSENLRVKGFKDAMTSAPLASIETKASSTGFFSAEEVTRGILYDDPDVNTIICTSAKDTISVAQIIVDLNKVGQITIIGYGDATEILRYIEKGVIYGTVVADPFEIGYQSIKSLVEIKKDKMTSAYVDTGTKVVTVDNVEEYISKQASDQEKDSADK